MSNMKDLMALFKSASLLSGDQETNYLEAEDIYSAAFKLCEELNATGTEHISIWQQG